MSSNRKLLLLVSIAVAAALFAGGSILAADDTSDGEEPRAGLYRVGFDNAVQLKELAERLDVWEVDHLGRTTLTLLRAAEAQSLDQEGFELEWVEPPPETDIQASLDYVNFSEHIPGYACYRTVATLERDMRRLVKANPELAQWIDIGDSWERSTYGAPNGHDIRALVLTNRAKKWPKYRFLVLAEVHARELVTSELAARFAEHLVDNYGIDADVTWLLDYGEVHIIPLGNPDGREWAEQLYYWRKNTNATNGCSIAEIYGRTYGVDLNRNFRYRWDGCTSTGCSSSDPCAATYRGAEAVSEPETHAIQTYTKSLFPDQRGAAISAMAPITTTGLAVSLHSYAEMIMYPWGWSTEPTSNADGLQMLGERLASPNGYRVCQSGEPGCLYLLDGDFADWAYGKLGIAAYTIEYGTEFFQSCSEFEEVILEPAIESLTLGYKHARQPYASTAAPEIHDVKLASALIQPGDALTVTVRLDTSAIEPGDRFGFQLSVDGPSWTDEAYGVKQYSRIVHNPGKAAKVTAIVDTDSWTIGRDMLFIEPLGEEGEVGVPTALYVDVYNGQSLYLPAIINSVRMHRR